MARCVLTDFGVRRRRGESTVASQKLRMSPCSDGDGIRSPLTPMGGVGVHDGSGSGFQLFLYVQKIYGRRQRSTCIANEHRKLLPWSVGRWFAGCLILNTLPTL